MTLFGIMMINEITLLLPKLSSPIYLSNEHIFDIVNVINVN